MTLGGSEAASFFFVAMCYDVSCHCDCNLILRLVCIRRTTKLGLEPSLPAVDPRNTDKKGNGRLGQAKSSVAKRLGRTGSAGKRLSSMFKTGGA